MVRRFCFIALIFFILLRINTHPALGLSCGAHCDSGDPNIGTNCSSCCTGKAACSSFCDNGGHGTCAWSINNSCTNWCACGPCSGGFCGQFCCDNVHVNDYQVVSCGSAPSGCPSWKCINGESSCAASCSGGSCADAGSCSGFTPNRCNVYQSCPPSCNTSSPGVPVPASPISGEQFGKVNPITLNWSDVSWGEECSSNAGRYYQVCVGSDATDPCNGGLNTSVTSSGTPPSTYDYTPTISGDVYWEVKSSNNANKQSAWSAIGHFIVDYPPTIVTASSNPVVIPGTGTANLAIVTNDLDGAADISKVYFGFNNCSVDPGAANQVNFEHNGANYFEAAILNGVTKNIAKNSGGISSCVGGASGSSPWVAIPGTNAPGTLTLNSITNAPSGNQLTSTFNVTTNKFTGGTYNYYGMVQDSAGLWQSGTANAEYKKLGSVCVEGGAVLSNWTTCDANHQRRGTCTENCGNDDCLAAGAVGGIVTENCIGTIQGTLFDASDLAVCPGDIGTNAIYAPLRYGSQSFGISGTWPLISLPVSTVANGTYSEPVYTSTPPAHYIYDYTNLFNSGRAAAIKLECQSAAVDLTDQAQVITKDTGFWRVYGGWWQVIGGSVYAGGNINGSVKSSIPASVVPAGNQKLILPDASGRFGMLSYGTPWAGTELGTNPAALVSSPLWRIQSLYGGLRYDYNFYKTRMDVFAQTDWDGGAINYNDAGVGYQIFKYTGQAGSMVSLVYPGPTGTQKVVLMIDGDVTINNDVVTPKGAFLGVIASGNITFGSGVTKAQGWFVGENINVACVDTTPKDGVCDKTDVAFKGEGSFVGWTGINLKRDMFTLDNTNPSETFTYRSDFVLNTPTPMRVFTKKFSPFIP